jgi:hypothetical protein
MHKIYGISDKFLGKKYGISDKIIDEAWGVFDGVGDVRMTIINGKPTALSVSRCGVCLTLCLTTFYLYETR